MEVTMRSTRVAITPNYLVRYLTGRCNRLTLAGYLLSRFRFWTCNFFQFDHIPKHDLLAYGTCPGNDNVDTTFHLSSSYELRAFFCFLLDHPIEQRTY